MDPVKPDQDKEKLAEQYDKFVKMAHEFYTAGRDMSQEALSVAVSKTRAQMTALGELSADQASSFANYMKRDLEQTAEDVTRMGENAKEHLSPRRIGAGALSSLASLLQTGADSLRNLAGTPASPRTYNTGEVTSAGTLTCTACRHQEQFSKTGVVPTCSNCRGTVFEKLGE